ncbi:MAG: restriction endonuclease [Acidimicrobiales bacterium]
MTRGCDTRGRPRQNRPFRSAVGNPRLVPPAAPGPGSGRGPLAASLLTPAGFEEAVAELLVAAGWRHVHVIGGSGDLGADVVGTDPDGRRGIVQCKHLLRDAAVGSPFVLATLGALTVHEAERGLVVTTGRFTPAAVAWPGVTDWS